MCLGITIYYLSKISQSPTTEKVVVKFYKEITLKQAIPILVYVYFYIIIYEENLIDRQLRSPVLEKSNKRKHINFCTQYKLNIMRYVNHQSLSNEK